MAQKKRSGLNQVLVSILLGLLIASFAVWGVGGGMFVSSNRVMATVGETEIETADVVRIVQNRAQQMQQQFGATISTQELINQLQLHTQTLQELISLGAITDNAASLGLQGSDKQMAQEMLKIDVFQPIKKGVIDRQTVMTTLQSVGMTYAGYERDTKREIAQNQLVGAITAATPVSRTLAEQLYTFRRETRTATLLALPGTIIKDIPKPEEGELESYYETHKTRYMAPEYRSYNYVLLTPESFEDQVEINEDDLLKEFEYKQSEYSVPTTRTLQQVSLDDEAAAIAFIERINAGEDFVTVAVELSDFTEEEITLPVADYDQVEADFSVEVADAVFALDEDKMSEPHEGFAGWSVFKVVGITQGSEKSFDDVKAELQAAYVADQAINLLYEFSDQIEEALSEGGDLTEISKQLNIPMATIEKVDNQGRRQDGGMGILTEAGAYILREAYQGEIGDFLELKDMKVDVEDRRMFLLELTEEVEPTQKPLDAVMTELRASWDAEKRQEAIGLLAEATLERVRNGEISDELAVELDGTSYAANNISRTGTANAGMSATLRTLIFSMKAGQADMEVAADGNGYIIAKLMDIKPADPKANAGQVDVIHAQLQTNMGNELMAQYQASIGRELEVVVNQELFRQTFNIAQQ